MEILIKVSNHGFPLLFAVGNLVETRFYLGGKVIINDAWEIFDQEVGGDFGDAGW